MRKKQTSCCVEASKLLEEILCKYNKDSIKDYRVQMHEIEHRADEVHHERKDLAWYQSCL